MCPQYALVYICNTHDTIACFCSFIHFLTENCSSSCDVFPSSLFKSGSSLQCRLNADSRRKSAKLQKKRASNTVGITICHHSNIASMKPLSLARFFPNLVLSFFRHNSAKSRHRNQEPRSKCGHWTYMTYTKTLTMNPRNLSMNLFGETQKRMSWLSEKLADTSINK